VKGGPEKERAESARLFVYFSGLKGDLARWAMGNKALFCLNLWGVFNSGMSGAGGIQ
jgi:hypothetical protein